MTKYKCNLCNKVVVRSSKEKSIPSYCSTTGKNTRLWRIHACGDSTCTENHGEPE